MDRKALLNSIMTVGMLCLAAAAVAVLIFTAVELICSPDATVYFFRTSVWRMVCCGCIAVIFPTLVVIERRGKRKDDKND